jgi:hypothetical protein
MQTFWLILLAAPFLLIVMLAFLALLVAGIRRGDRASLHNSSRNCVDSITRRVLGVGVRNESNDDEGR